MTLDLLGGLDTEQLNGVSEQSAISFSVATQTRSIPGTEMVSMAYRGRAC